MSDADTLDILRRLFFHEDSIANASRLTGAERQALVYAREHDWITRNYLLTDKGRAVIRRTLAAVSSQSCPWLK